MKIGVYTIALNEEHFVQKWFDSAQDADFLLIADTGSKDDTVKVAKSLGIEVVEISVNPWRFDNARNAALSLMPKDLDYCIALDMDEVLVDGWREHLELVDPDVTRPRYQYTWSWNDLENRVPGLQYAGDKIHKRFGYRWKHPVHEVIVPDRIKEVDGWVGLQIEHYPDNKKPRSQYLDLLKVAVDEDPLDDRNAYYYARELFFYNRKEEAKEQFLRHLSLPKATWKPERSSSMRYLAQCSSGEEREQWFLKAFEESPDRREPLVDLAVYYYENQKWKESLKFAEKALEIKEKPLEYLCEEKAWSEMPYDLAAIASYSLGEYEKALEYGVQASRIKPNDDRLKKNLAFYANKNKQS